MRMLIKAVYFLVAELTRQLCFSACRQREHLPLPGLVSRMFRLRDEVFS